MYNVYRYVVANNGVDGQSSYPFQGRVRQHTLTHYELKHLDWTSYNVLTLQQSSCSFSTKNVGATMSNFINIPSGDETSLQKAVAYVGPVSVAVDAANKAFRVRPGGIEKYYAKRV